LKILSIVVEKDKKKVSTMKTETIYETYARTLCKNCKNRKNCIEELKKRLGNTIYCKNYEREKKAEGYKQFKGRTANQGKPIMKEIAK